MVNWTLYLIKILTPGMHTGGIKYLFPVVQHIAWVYVRNFFLLFNMDTCGPAATYVIGSAKRGTSSKKWFREKAYLKN